MAASDILCRRMNREFRVKVNHGSVSRLVGWRGLVSIVGLPKAKWLVLEAFKRKTDIYTWKSRKGLIVRFYLK